MRFLSVNFFSPSYKSQHGWTHLFIFHPAYRTAVIMPYPHALSNIYTLGDLIWLGAAAISFNELCKCMETFIIYPPAIHNTWWKKLRIPAPAVSSSPFFFFYLIRIYTCTCSARLRTCREPRLPITEYNAHISHALLWPGKSSSLQDTPAYFQSADFLTVCRLIRNKWLTNNPHIRYKKQSNPYLKLWEWKYSVWQRLRFPLLSAFIFAHKGLSPFFYSFFVLCPLQVCANVRF